ncbi:hypothetical protein GALL_554840 [mine drainage metagenome]|uniref:Uncharacterized protein n=1 Tax=mine drainage metagenome TaxID=410659 RepID=A0A1J5P6D3_9ZZZZ
MARGQVGQSQLPQLRSAATTTVQQQAYGVAAPWVGDVASREVDLGAQGTGQASARQGQRFWPLTGNLGGEGDGEHPHQGPGPHRSSF